MEITDFDRKLTPQYDIVKQHKDPSFLLDNDGGVNHREMRIIADNMSATVKFRPLIRA